MTEEKIDGLKNKLQKLVSDFKAADGWDKSEEDLQTSFTVELLKILGWDSSDWKINTGQDVQTGKKPDIVLKAGSSKLLVIESKDAHKKDMLDGAYQDKTFTEQLFNYCHGEGLSWGILTNFVEWRLYSAYRKILYKNIKYAFHDLLWEGANKNDYVDLLSEEGLFFLSKISKKNLLAKLGKIDSDPVYYPEQLDLAVEKVKKEFFDKIKNWRSQLKKYIEKNYPRSGADKIDLMAQQIIDRMIFIDICHDKGVVGENHIKSVLSSKLPKFEELKEKFRLMNDKFDTELFDHSECDEIKINDLVMIPIIKELDEIDFSKLSVNIIGEVYENYLGELLKTTSDKPGTTAEKQRQKRKAQGIYYTPDYIVDYIIKNTVGVLLNKVKTEKEIEKIRVVDPACGSGSFLIRVFDEFLKTYRRILKVPEGQTTLDEFYYRRKILQNNIFGVDLDERAVEITKLNLMIKALDKVKPRDMQGTHLLPNLSLNIRCGNSLIGGEKIIEKENNFNLVETYYKEILKLIEIKEKFYHEKDGGGRSLISDEIKKLENFVNRNINKDLDEYFKNQDKFKPFNYKVAFCEIFKDGGFDVVVGNPPYVNLANIKSAEERDFYKNEFETAKNKSDLYSFFAERTVDILRHKGLLGFIFSNSWLGTDSFSKFREFLLKETKILELVKLPAGVFKDAMVTTILIFFEKGEVSANHTIKLLEYKDDNFKNLSYGLSYRRIKNSPNFSFSFNPELKIKTQTVKLGGIAKLSMGIKTSDNDKFILDSKKDENTYPLLIGKNVGRYFYDYEGKWVWYKPELMIKKAGAGPRKPEYFRTDKLVFREISGGLIIATFDSDKYFTNNKLHILYSINSYSLKFILGIVNSSFINSWVRATFGDLLEIEINQLEQIPIPDLDLAKKEDKKIHDQLVKLVDEMLELNKTAESREKNKIQIETVDYEIDQLVYKLYGLTAGEIKVIENN